MDSIKSRLVALAFALTLIVGTCPAQSDTTSRNELPDREKPAAAAAVKLRLDVPERLETHVAHGLLFEMSLVNDGAEPVTFFCPGEAYTDVFRFDITRPDGRKLSARGGLSAPTAESRDFRTLGPGEKAGYSMSFDFPRSSANCQEFAFTEPGEYTVRPSFVSLTDEALDLKTGKTSKVPGAWVGAVAGRPFKIVVSRAAREDATGRLKIEGRVMDKAGNLVPETLIFVKMEKSSMNSPTGRALFECGRDYSSAQGTFAFEHLPENAPEFVIEASNPDYQPSRTRLVVKPGTLSYELKLELDPGATLRGIVRGTDGQPIAGARVSEGGNYSRYTCSDAQGRFELRGVEQPAAECHAWKETYAGQYYTPPAGARKAEDWIITLVRKSEQSFSGKVSFADGAPAAGLYLDFQFAGLNNIASGSTEKDGSYSAYLYTGKGGDGAVWAKGPAPVTPAVYRRQWQAPVRSATLGAKNVNVVFENRGTIEAVIKPGNVLPKTIHFQVSCSMAVPPDERWEFMTSREVGAEGGTVRFDDKLGPGKYRIEVRTANAEGWNWSQDVTLAGEGKDLNRSVRFALPELHFGGLRARVLRADGKTPLAKGRAWLDHTASSGSVPIRDGKIEIADLPVGKAWLTVNQPDNAAARAEGLIRAGEVTDLGDIVLKDAAKATGWVAGRVLYDDGTPALGIAPMVVFGPEGNAPVGADGGFRMQLPAGKGTVVLETAGAPGWPRRMEGTAAIPLNQYDNMRRTNDTVLVPVEVEAGKTVKRDVILRREGMRNVTVKSDLHGQAWALAIIRSGDSIVARVLYGSGDNLYGTSDLPAGELLLIFQAGDYVGYREFPADAKNAEAVFDHAQTGVIRGKVTHPDGTPTARLRLEYRPAPFAWYGPLQGLSTGYWPLPSNVGICFAQTAADGTYRTANLSPGTYLIEPPGEGPAKPQTVEVVAGKEVTINFVSAALSEQPPPLRQ